MTKAIDLGHIKGPVFIPNVAAIRLVWQLPSGKKAANVLHAQFATPPTVTQAFVNALFTSLTTGTGWSNHAGALHTTTLLTALGFRDMTQVSTGVGHAEVLSTVTAVPGTAAASDPLPANVAFVVSLKTGLSLQANRGRVYLPGFAESANDTTGHASTTVVSNAVAWVTQIQTVLAAQSLNMCIAHPARKAYTGDAGAAHADRPAGFVVVQQVLALNSIWDSTRLRSRL